ncbi:MAG: hypothetical protein ACLUVF_03865 [Adlercreutzia sp.]|uniref:PBECR3 domain-containing polyvalent protein n=1 Tax=Adlercreutzia equolifaciens TaxID=446660 RepID=UPI0015F03FFE
MRSPRRPRRSRKTPGRRPRTARKPQSYERGGRLPGHRLPRIVGYVLGLAPPRRQHGGQQSIAPSDFALIPKVLNEFDACEHANKDKLGNKKPLFGKEIENTVYLVTAQRGKGKLEVKTMWEAQRSGASC